MLPGDGLALPLLTSSHAVTSPHAYAATQPRKVKPV